MKFCAHPFLIKKLITCRNRRYQTIIAYSRHTHCTIEIKCLYEKLFICREILIKFDTAYCPRQGCSLLRNGSDQIAITYSCNVNFFHNLWQNGYLILSYIANLPASHYTMIILWIFISSICILYLYFRFIFISLTLFFSRFINTILYYK